MGCVGRCCDGIRRRLNLLSLLWTIVFVLAYVIFIPKDLVITDWVIQQTIGDELKDRPKIVATVEADQKDLNELFDEVFPPEPEDELDSPTGEETSGDDSDWDYAHYDCCDSPALEESDGQTVTESEIVEKASLDDLMEDRSIAKPIGSPPRTLEFIFHNKVPKSGSSTMKHIFAVLAPRNRFAFDHVRIIKFHHEQHDRLVHHLTKFKRSKAKNFPIVLLKHHTFLNFTNYNFIQPTYINVVRHPVSLFASYYYFKRYGWELNTMIRPTFHGKPEDLDLTLDECVEQQRDECMNAIETLTKYFCGIDEYCSPKNNFVHKKDATGKIRITTDLGKAAKAAEQAKKNIVQQYFTIGVLEHFDATLQLFEKMLPSVFTGATEAYNSEYVQKYRNMTRTKHDKSYSESTRMVMENIFRYDMDIYNLCKAIFYKQAAYHNIAI